MPLFRSCAVLLLWSSLVVAGDWPGWLGPRRDGGTDEKIAPWKGPLKIVWRQPVGEGHSSPVVAGGKVYLHTMVKDANQETLSAFDANSGTLAWTKTYERGPFKSLFGNGPRGTPSVLDGKVYTFGITGILTCFDAKSGAQVWQVDTLKEFKVGNLFFGASCSPLVEGDLVLVNVGGKKSMKKDEKAITSALVAVNKNDGTIVWHKLDDKASYSSPIALGKGDGRQVIFLTAEGLVAVAPKDGSVFWQFPLKDKLFESSTTPVAIGDILFASSITFGGVGLKLDNSQAIPKASQVWMKEDLTCYFSTPIAVGKEHLYVVTGTKPSLGALLPGQKKNQADLHCIDAASGKELWHRPKVGTYHASLLRTGDGKLLLLEEPGDLVLVDPNPKQYRELARSKICGNTWAHPALANGRLYVRDSKELICVQVAE